MSKADIMRLNLAAGLIAGLLLGVGEILVTEIHTRIKARALVADITDIGEKTAPREPGE
jgi:hypothetical protein